MTADQLHSLDEMLRTGPLDLGGDLQEQRLLLVEMLTAIPLPDDVRTNPGDLAGVPVITIDIDLTLSGATATTKADVDLAVTAAGLRTRGAEYVGAGEATTPTISPVFADLAGLPSLLIQAGSHEILLDDALRIAAHAAVADVAVDLQITPGAPHVFQGFAAILTEGETAMAAAGEFLRAHLAGGRHT